MKVNIKITGAKKTGSKLLRIEKMLGNTKRVNLSAIVVVDRWVQDNFKAEGGKHKDTSLKWKKLSATTIRQRRKNNKDIKILQDTGSLKTRWDLKANDRFGELKSRVTYSINHEEGINTPKRKIFPTEKQAISIVKPVYQIYVDEIVK